MSAELIHHNELPMSLQEPVEPTTNPRPRRRWLWFGLVLALAGLFWLPRLKGDAVPAPVTREPSVSPAPAALPEEVRLVEPRGKEPSKDRVFVEANEAASVELAPAPLAVLPDAFLTLRAVDRTGRPVPGVGFEWVYESVDGSITDNSIDGITDAAGLVRVVEAPKWWGALVGDGELTPHDKLMAAYLKRVGVRSRLPFNEYQPVGEGSDGEEAPGVLWFSKVMVFEGPVDVALPPFGYVDFQWDSLQGGDGERIDSYYLHIRRSDGGHFPGWRTGFYVEEGATHHRFGPVGLGWQVYGELTAKGVYGKLGRDSGAGPTVEGETVPLRIEIGAEQRNLAHVSGVALDPSGSPLSEKEIEVTFGDPRSKETPRRHLRTDADGRWTFNLARARLGSQIHVVRKRVKPAQAGRGLLDLSDPKQGAFDAGAIQLHELKLEEPKERLLASGRILDHANGAPIRGATASIYGHARSVSGKSRDSKEWTLLGSTRTGKDGAFQVEAEVDLADPVVRVWASESDYQKQEPQDVNVGASDIEFRLVEGAAVRLQIEVEAILEITDYITLRFEGEGVRRSPSLMDFTGGYRGRFGGLAPGKYELTVLLHGGDAVLHRQEVDVIGDVDLGTIDLQGLTVSCHLWLQDAGGSTISGRYVSVLDLASGTTIDRSAKVDDRGRVTLRVPANLGAVAVERGGIGSAEVPSSWFTPLATEGDAERRTLVLGP